jgi:YidC/Oxa1 family membrane protein insertase
MNPIVEIYNLIFYQPIYQSLFFFHSFLKDFGLAVILLTVIIRVILFPLQYKTSKEQEKLLKLKKSLEEIEKKYDGEQKAKEILSLYQKNKVNPFFNLFSLFFQLPILIALYQVFLKGLNQVDPLLFNFLDLSKPNFLLVLVVVLLQFFYLKLNQPKGIKEKSTPPFQAQTNFFLTLFTFLILLRLPSAISLYLATNNLFLIFQKILFHA